MSDVIECLEPPEASSATTTITVLASLFSVLGVPALKLKGVPIRVRMGVVGRGWE